MKDVSLDDLIAEDKKKQRLQNKKKPFVHCLLNRSIRIRDLAIIQESIPMIKVQNLIETLIRTENLLDKTKESGKGTTLNSEITKVLQTKLKELFMRDKKSPKTPK